MKRKRIPVYGMTALKWHSLFFLVVSIVLWLSVLATFEYSGNRDVPFAAFKPFLVERIGFTVLWSILLAAHFGIVEVRQLIFQRVYHDHLNSLSPSNDAYSPRWKHNLTVEDDEVIVMDEEIEKHSARRMDY